MIGEARHMESVTSFSIWNIVAESFVAIILMTLFSYIAGILRKKQFTEPVILNDLLRRINVVKSKNNYRNPLGWIIHYTVGLIFIICYHFIWSHNFLAPTVLNGALLGGVCGVIGIAGWHTTLSIHPNPPAIDLKEYYIQLFFAHVIFGISATITELVI